ncbi:MAG: 30S ribosomal protein S17 [Simkaniaceae bacterium]|nr:30S ribosomal protein S17 [Simkaniaceae bacterium]
MENKSARKSKVGTVVSNKMDKTVTVSVTTRMPHPQYGKIVDRSKKYYAHTDQKIENGAAVRIVETRPISKLKRWRVVEVMEKQGK